MFNIKSILISIVAIIIFIIYIQKSGELKGKQEVQVIQQEQQIKVKDEIIKEIKTVSKRKEKNIITPIDTQIEWLLLNACYDCNTPEN